jgi:hypothetical protein
MKALALLRCIDRERDSREINTLLSLTPSVESALERKSTDIDAGTISCAAHMILNL